MCSLDRSGLDLSQIQTKVNPCLTQILNEQFEIELNSFELLNRSRRITKNKRRFIQIRKNLQRRRKIITIKEERRITRIKEELLVRRFKPNNDLNFYNLDRICPNI